MSFRPHLLLSLALVVGALLPGAPLRADEAETMPELTLKRLVQRQKDLLEQAREQGQNLDQESLRVQLQEICHGYELLLNQAPKMAEAYAAYGYLLRQVGMDKQSVGLMLKANELNPDLPIVKNEIGNYLAEQGKPLEAVGYYLAAIKLEPTEPLYHYQLGTLLYEARDDFIRSGDWTVESVDKAMQEAFKRATELAPDRLDFAYGYGESFYQAHNPDWNQALALWVSLEKRAHSPLEKQTILLHEANVLLKLNRPQEAAPLLGLVSEKELQADRQKLIAQIAEIAKK